MDVIVKPTPTLKGDIGALSSKNYTTRYLLAAALAEGTSTIHFLPTARTAMRCADAFATLAPCWRKTTAKS